MRTQSIDTNKKAEKVLISLYQNVTISERLSKIRSLTQTTLFLSRRAIARAHSNLTERQIDLIFVSHLYGKELADDLEKYLDRIDHEKS